MKKSTLLLLFCLQIYHLHAADIYVHMMPWFETKETNNGTWGQHWTMVNENPDELIDGLPDIASFYHPEIGPYASGDPDVIDWQLGHMKAAGIKGIFLDWPGTTDAYDYPKNKENCEAIIEGTIRNGLQFAIVWEDNNLNLAGVPDIIGQGQLDMLYIQENYFPEENYVTVNGAPLLLDFGPQSLWGQDWDQVLSVFNPMPTFLLLWNQSNQGGAYPSGEFAWVWADYVDTLIVWYATRNVTVKVGVAYPGFHPFYGLGGWPGPMFWIDYGIETFNTTWQMAINNTEIVQLCTWNDYGEGTIVEPTVEYGTQFLDIVQDYTGVKYTKKDFDELTDIYYKRKQHAKDPVMLEKLKQQHYDLVHKFD